MARAFAGGASDNIDVGNALNTSTGTICCWVKLSSASNDFWRVLTNRASSTWGYVLGKRSGADQNKIALLVAMGGSFRSSGNSTTVFNDDAWHFIVGDWVDGASAQVNLYVDDMTTAQASATGNYGSYNTSSENLTIGNQPGSTVLSAGGSIAEVRVFDRQLNANERLAVKYSSGLNLGPILYAPLWGTHTTEVDLSTNRRSLTVTNTSKANHAPVRPFTWFKPATFELGGNVTFTPDAATYSWSVPSPNLSLVVQLTAGAVSYDYAVPSQTLTPGAVNFAPTPAAYSWAVLGDFIFRVGGGIGRALKSWRASRRR